MEIPTADTAPTSIAQLGLDTAAALSGALGGAASPMLLVFATAGAAEAAGKLKGRPTGCRVLELREACRTPSLNSQLLLVVAPTVSDVSTCP